MKNLLFVDDMILRYDQSAGARSSFMYLQLFLDMGYRVTFCGYDFVRSEPYGSYLESLGVKLITGRFRKYTWIIWLAINAGKFDVVYFNRPIQTIKNIFIIKLFSKAKLLYQCHDLHYLRYKRQYELTKDIEDMKKSTRFKLYEKCLYRNVDVALTYSYYEKQVICSQYKEKSVYDLPLFFYKEAATPIADFSARMGLVYVGGFNHTPNVDAVLWFSREVLPIVAKVLPDIKFIVVGSRPPKEISDLDADNVRIVGYLDDGQLLALYQQVRLMVVPLRYGAGVKGKVLEAIHGGIPLVSTSIGLEGIADIEMIAAPVDSAQDFAEAVVRLYRDEKLLAAMSAAFCDYSKKHLGYEVARREMEQILEVVS